MFFNGLGTAVPSNRYLQAECWGALQGSREFEALSPRSRAILRKVLLGNNGIASRHLALSPLTEAFDLRPDVLHARFLRNAPELAAQAARRALDQAGLPLSEVDALIISTCTGYLCPGLTSYVMERLGLERPIPAFDLVGQGCGAALPNLHLADTLIAAGRARHVLTVCVEVCSAAFYLDDDPGVLISACLFGDGAGAAVLSKEPRRAVRPVEWTAYHTAHSTSDRDYLRFESRGGLLRNILTRQACTLAGKYGEFVLTKALRQAGLEMSNLNGWILHPGGRDILVVLRERLGLTEADTAESAAVLSEYGNLSSPSVLFVLDAALRAGRPGGWWWMSSFGAGFSCHGALLKVAA